MSRVTAGFLILLTIWLGGMLTTQVGINGLLRGNANGAIHAALISTTVSTLSLTIATIIQRKNWPSLPEMLGMPWWLWTGGLLGALYVVLSPVMAVRMGGAFFFAVVIVGQMLSSLLLDHYGLLGFPQHEISLPRVLGVMMLIGGVLLIRLF